MASSELKKELQKKNEDETASLPITRDPLPDYTGHRQRLRQRFLTSGAGALADYELLEMILYAASPRTDTKPLAKKLLAHFGDFSKAKLTPAAFPAPSTRIRVPADCKHAYGHAAQNLGLKTHFQSKRHFSGTSLWSGAASIR